MFQEGTLKFHKKYNFSVYTKPYFLRSSPLNSQGLERKYTALGGRNPTYFVFFRNKVQHKRIEYKNDEECVNGTNSANVNM